MWLVAAIVGSKLPCLGKVGEVRREQQSGGLHTGEETEEVGSLRSDHVSWI
jgi:hypothetical protein